LDRSSCGPSALCLTPTQMCFETSNLLDESLNTTNVESKD
jgi:hypothetical protein